MATMSLPLSKSASPVPSPVGDQPGCQHRPAWAKACKTSAASARVLLVDDSPLILKMMSRMCAKMGIAYDTATNGEDALELMTPQHIQYPPMERPKPKLAPNPHPNPSPNPNPRPSPNPHPNPGKYTLVLMDRCMPGLHGHVVCQRAREAGYEGAVVLLTGDQISDPTAMRKQFGLSDILTKSGQRQSIQKILKYIID